MVLQLAAQNYYHVGQNKCSIILYLKYCYELSMNPLSSSPVRISGFHPDDPRSNPGNGRKFLLLFILATT
jgi:hypothetical protein